MIAIMAGLVLLVGTTAESCGKANDPNAQSTDVGAGPANRPKDNRPPNKPDSGSSPDDPDWISFFAFVRDPSGNVTPDGQEWGTVTVGAFDPNMQPYDLFFDSKAGVFVPNIMLPVTYAYQYAVHLNPEVSLVSFTASAFLPEGWTIECRVLHGNIVNQPGSPLYVGFVYRHSDTSTAGAVQVGATCTYPGI